MHCRNKAKRIRRQSHCCYSSRRFRAPVGAGSRDDAGSLGRRDAVQQGLERSNVNQNSGVAEVFFRPTKSALSTSLACAEEYLRTAPVEDCGRLSARLARWSSRVPLLLEIARTQTDLKLRTYSDQRWVEQKLIGRGDLALLYDSDRTVELRVQILRAHPKWIVPGRNKADPISARVTT